MRPLLLQWLFVSTSVLRRVLAAAASEILILDWHYVVKIGIEQVRTYLRRRNDAGGDESESADTKAKAKVTLFMDDLYAIRTPQSNYFPDYCHRGPVLDPAPALPGSIAQERVFGNVTLQFVAEEDYFCPVANSVRGPLAGALRQGRWVSESLNPDGSVPADDGSLPLPQTATRFFVDKTRDVLRTAYRDFFSQYGVCVMFGGRQTAAVCLLNNVPTVWVPHLSLAHTHTKADVSFFLDEVLGGEQRVVARRGSAEDASDSKVHLTLSAVGGRPTPLLSLAVSYFDMAFLDYLAGKQNFVPYPLVYLTRDALLRDSNTRRAWEAYHAHGGSSTQQEQEAAPTSEDGPPAAAAQPPLRSAEINEDAARPPAAPYEPTRDALPRDLNTRTDFFPRNPGQGYHGGKDAPRPPPPPQRYILFGGRKLPGAHGGSAADPWLMEWVLTEVGDWVLHVSELLRGIYKSRITADRMRSLAGVSSGGKITGAANNSPREEEDSTFIGTYLQAASGKPSKPPGRGSTGSSQEGTGGKTISEDSTETGQDDSTETGQDPLCKYGPSELWRVIADEERGLLASARNSPYPWPEFSSTYSRFVRWIQKEAEKRGEGDLDKLPWQKLLVDKMGSRNTFRLCRDYAENAVVENSEDYGSSAAVPPRFLLSRTGASDQRNQVEPRRTPTAAVPPDSDESGPRTSSHSHYPVILSSFGRHFPTGKYEWADVLKDVKAMIILPYSTVPMFWHEAHALGIPLFAPSVALLWRWHLQLQRVVLRRLERQAWAEKHAAAAAAVPGEEAEDITTSTTTTSSSVVSDQGSGPTPAPGTTTSPPTTTMEAEKTPPSQASADSESYLQNYARSVMLNEILYLLTDQVSWHPSYYGNSGGAFHAVKAVLQDRKLLYEDDPSDSSSTPAEEPPGRGEAEVVLTDADFLNRTGEYSDLGLAAEAQTVLPFDVPFLDEHDGVFRTGNAEKFRAQPSAKCQRFCPRGQKWSPFRMFESKPAFFYWASKLDFYHWGDHVVRFSNMTDLAYKLADDRLLQWMRAQGDRRVAQLTETAKNTFADAMDAAFRGAAEVI